MMKLPHCVARLRLSKLVRCLGLLCLLKICLLLSLAWQGPEESARQGAEAPAVAALEEKQAPDNAVKAESGKTREQAVTGAGGAAVPAGAVVSADERRTVPSAAAEHAASPSASAGHNADSSSGISVAARNGAAPSPTSSAAPSTALSAAAMLSALDLHEAVTAQEKARPQGAAAVAAALAQRPRTAHAAQAVPQTGQNAAASAPDAAGPSGQRIAAHAAVPQAAATHISAPQTALSQARVPAAQSGGASAAAQAAEPKTAGRILLDALLTLPGVGENPDAQAAPLALPSPSAPAAGGASPFMPPEQAAAGGNGGAQAMPSPPVNARPFDPAAPQGTIPALRGTQAATPAGQNGGSSAPQAGQGAAQPAGQRAGQAAAGNAGTASGASGAAQNAGNADSAAARSSASAAPSGAMGTALAPSAASAPAAEAASGGRGLDVLPQFRDSSSLPVPTARGGSAARGPEDEAQDSSRREQEVLMLKQQVEQRLKELEDAERRMQSMLKEARGVEEAKLKRMIQMYSNMKPKTAAKALESMDERIAVRILAGLQPKQAGEILSYADPVKSAKLTELMTRMQLPQ